MVQERTRPAEPESVELTVLRARAVCASCDSRLPPRSEAFVDSKNGTVWCVTCERYERLEAEETTARAAWEAEVLRSATEERAPEPAESSDFEGFLAPGGRAAVANEAEEEFEDQGNDPAEPARAPTGLHHESPPETAIGPAAVTPTGAGVVTRLRLRTPSRRTGNSGLPEEFSFDRVMDQRPDHQPDVACVSSVDRGDPGEERVGQTLEAARIHGLEVLHQPTMPVREAIDHLAVCTNGIWVVKAVAALTGRLERRDGGDWFTADPRLHIGGDDRSHLVAVVRRQVEAVSAVASDAGFSDIPVRGVLCFGSVNPEWVTDPFVIDGISVTWRARLIDPMLGPALIDTRTRASLVQTLASVRSSEQPESDDEAEDEQGPEEGQSHIIAG